MASSTGLRSGIARHGRALVSVILFQALLIVWLSSWVVGDYLNNQYVRAYVNTTFQADTWLIGSIVLLGIVGSSAGLVLRRKRHAAVNLGVTSTHSKIPRPALATSSTKPPTQTMVASKAAAPPAVTPVSFSKPSSELHPAVAALKADLSEARMSLGLASVVAGAEKGPSPSTKSEDHEITPPQRPTVMNSPLFGPRPQTPAPSQTQPATASPPTPSPMLPQTLAPRPLPPTVIRPMAPPLPSRPSANGQAMPLLKVETAPPATPKPVGLLPRPQTPPTTPKDVSTVITGIMPGQQQPPQKKKEPESSTGQTNSQQ